MYITCNAGPFSHIVRHAYAYAGIGALRCVLWIATRAVRHYIRCFAPRAVQETNQFLKMLPEHESKRRTNAPKNTQDNILQMYTAQPQKPTQ